MSPSDNETDQTTEKETPFLAPENMEFVHCPECYGEMAADTPVCPHCGMAPHADEQQKNKIVHIIWVLLIGLGATTILAGFIFDFTGPGMIAGGFLLLAASLIKRFIGVTVGINGRFSHLFPLPRHWYTSSYTTI